MDNGNATDPPPELGGWMLKKSPGVRRFLPGATWQRRYVSLHKGRFVYASTEHKPADGHLAASGMVEFLSNECEVSSEAMVITLKAKNDMWSKGDFTGAEAGRVFEFDCTEEISSGRVGTVEEWVDTIQKHIDFALSVKLALLAKVPLVKRLPAEQHIQMASACVATQYKPGDVIVRQGDLGDEFFVIISGEASVVISSDKDGKDNDGDRAVATLKPGDYFGENALRNFNLPRVATVTAISELRTFQLKRQKFEELGLNKKLEFPNRRAVGMGNVMAKGKANAKGPPKSPEEVELISKALYDNRFLQTLTSLDQYKVKQLVDVARQETVEGGTVLINEGDLNGDSFYIVNSGRFQIIISEVEKGKEHSKKSLSRGKLPGANLPDPEIGPGGSFGELALLYLEPRAATVKSLEKSVVWIIDRYSFKDILMKVSNEKIKEYVELLKEVNNLACLLDAERTVIAKNLVEVQFAKDDFIVEQGEFGSTFYILYEGEVAIVKNGKTVKSLSATVEKGKAEYFGEAALLESEVRAASVLVTSNEAKALAMDRETFNGVLGPLKDIIDRTRKEGSSRKFLGPSARAKLQAAIAFQSAGKRTQRESILQSDLKKIGLLGCGGFGIVELVEHNQTGETYALKGLSKGYVVKAGMQKNVMNEKEIQINLSSAFIVKLFETYNTEQKLFFLLEPALGGELYATYMRKGLHGGVKHAQFYTAGTIFAFEYLHNRSYIYRDLKPENLLLTEKGNVKLTDMGLAKYVTGKTYTSCGTPDYFAPEIIKSAGHNKGVDWWELGILIFELMSGHPPFESQDPMETYAKICNGIERANFPLNCKGVVGDLVKQLCKKQPSERLPMRSGGIKNVKQHPWFISTKFDWEAMRLLTLQVPYKPVVKSKKDLANFPDGGANMPRQLEYKDDGSGWDKDFASAAPT